MNLKLDHVWGCSCSEGFIKSALGANRPKLHIIGIKRFFKRIFTGCYFYVFEQNSQKLAKSEDITSSTFVILKENGSYMSCCHSRTLRKMLQIAISEGPADFKIVSRSSTSKKRAFSMYLLYIFWYLASLLTILSDLRGFTYLVVILEPYKICCRLPL